MTTAIQKRILSKLAGQWKVSSENVATNPVEMTPTEIIALKKWFAGEKLSERMAVEEALTKWLKEGDTPEISFTNALAPGEFTISRKSLSMGWNADRGTIRGKLPGLEDSKSFSILLHLTDFNILKDKFSREKWFSQN